MKWRKQSWKSNRCQGSSSVNNHSSSSKSRRRTLATSLTSRFKLTSTFLSSLFCSILQQSTNNHFMVTLTLGLVCLAQFFLFFVVADLICPVWRRQHGSGGNRASAPSLFGARGPWVQTLPFLHNWCLIQARPSPLGMPMPPSKAISAEWGLIRAGGGSFLMRSSQNRCRQEVPQIHMCILVVMPAAHLYTVF